MSNSPKTSGQLKVSTNLRKALPSTVPKELIIESLLVNDGNVQIVAQDLGLMYLPLLQFIEKDYRLRDLVLASRTSLIDEAETVLRNNVRAGNLKASMFVLKTIGRERGYADMMEVKIPDADDASKSVDLDKLSVAQLRDLKKLMSTATSSDVIDVTPKDVTDEN